MTKINYVSKKIISGDLYKQLRPRFGQLDVELTERCNNMCAHCCINQPQNDIKAKQQELSTEQWKGIINQATRLGVHTIRFTGGEPLLRRDFVDLYLFTRQLGVKVLLFTNGRLITEQLAELFVKVPPHKKIEVSVYGVNPETYDAVACAKNAFDETLRGLNYLISYQIPFLIKAVILPPNRSSLEEFKDWAKQTSGQTIDPVYASLLNFRSRRDNPEKNVLIDHLRFTPEELITIWASDKNKYNSAMADFCSTNIGPPGKLIFSCGAGDIPCVDSYGNYQICMQLRAPDTVSNLKNSSFLEASTKVFQHLANMESDNPEYLRRCARCFLKGLCEQCPAKSWMENGTLDTPVEYLCHVAHYQARYLGLLEEGEQAWDVADWEKRISGLVKH